MKRRHILTVIFLLATIAAWSQIYDQGLVDLMQEEKMFEADRYYNRYKDSLRSDFVKTWYRAEAGRVFNRFEEAIEAYTQLIEKNYLKWDTLALVATYGQKLLNSCKYGGEYGKGIEATKLLISVLQKNTEKDEVDREKSISYIRDAQRYFEKKQRIFPKMEVVWDKKYKTSYQKTIKSSSDCILVESSWNGVSLRAIFDTGAGACMIWNRKIAHKIGLKLASNDTTITSAGRCLTGLVDSLRLGNVTVRNVPVFIRIDEVDKNDKMQVLCDSILTNSFDIILGLSVIRKMGIVKLDFINSIMEISEASLNKNRLAERNLFVDINSKLLVNLKVLEEPFLAFLDTGDPGGVIVNSGFYAKHMSVVSLKRDKPLTQFYGGCFSSNIHSVGENWTCDNLPIAIGDERIMYRGDIRVSKTKEMDSSFGPQDGGILGFDFIKSAKKVLFDFDRMSISILSD